MDASGKTAWQQPPLDSRRLALVFNVTSPAIGGCDMKTESCWKALSRGWGEWKRLRRLIVVFPSSFGGGEAHSRTGPRGGPGSVAH